MNFSATSGLAGIEAGVYHTLGWNAEGEIVMSVGNNDFGQLDVPEGLVVQKVSSSLYQHGASPRTDKWCAGATTNTGNAMYRHSVSRWWTLQPPKGRALPFLRMEVS